MTKAFSWWSESGGPGKTTNCVNSSAAIARDGYDVVAIDLDPQRGSMTHYLGFGELTHGDQSPTTMDVFFGDNDPREVIVETEHFDLIPGHESLSNFSSELSNSGRMGMNQFTVVRDVVEDLASDYDVVVLDCQASLSDLTDNAVFAARNVLVPLELTPKGFASQEGLEATVGAMHDGFEDLGVNISIAVSVPSRVGNAKIYEQYRDQLEAAGVPVSPFSIPEHSLLKYSWDAEMDLFEFMESEKTRDLRDYEEHVPLSYKMIGQIITGDLSQSDAVERWDAIKDQPMGDATPEALLEDETPGVNA